MSGDFGSESEIHWLNVKSPVTWESELGKKEVEDCTVYQLLLSEGRSGLDTRPAGKGETDGMAPANTDLCYIAVFMGKLDYFP